MADFESVWNAMDYDDAPLPIKFVREVAAYFWRARQPEIDRLKDALRDCRTEADNKWHVQGIVDGALHKAG